MNHMTHQAHEAVADSHARHKMSGAHANHDRHAGHSVAMFRDKFWLSFALTVPVVVWSADVQHWFGYRAPSFPGSNLIAPILGTVVFVYGGLVFLRGAWIELADHKLGMMTLISLATTVAFGTSLRNIRLLRDRSLVGTRIADHVVAADLANREFSTREEIWINRKNRERR